MSEKSVPDYRALLFRFMLNVYEDDSTVCRRCADGRWFSWSSDDQAVMLELLAEVEQFGAWEFTADVANHAVNMEILRDSEKDDDA